MLAYSIAAARDSGVFESVIVSTDSEDVAGIARQYGAEVPFLRPAEFAGDTSPDNIREIQASGYPLLHKPLSHARLRAAVTALIRRPAAPVAAAE